MKVKVADGLSPRQFDKRVALLKRYGFRFQPDSKTWRRDDTPDAVALAIQQIPDLVVETDEDQALGVEYLGSVKPRSLVASIPRKGGRDDGDDWAIRRPPSTFSEWLDYGD